MAVLVPLLAAPYPTRPVDRDPLQQEFTFVSRGGKLRGTLSLPAGPGPHPAIVAAHGSGHVTRRDHYIQQIARHYPPHGVAVLAFDKRGVGASDGEYPGSYGSSMVIYAMDVLAAVDALSERSDIDRSNIGLWGISQAWWIIPIAAAVGGERVRFTIIVSGTTVSIGEENYYSELTGDDRGVASGRSRSEIRQRMSEYEPRGLDAYSFIEEMRRPGLWLYGTLDQNIPWEQGVADLRDIVAEWDRDFMWHVFEGANHGLKRARTGGSWERPRPTETVAGYFDTMDAWLRNDVGLEIDVNH